MNDHRSLRDRIQDPDERTLLLKDAQAYEQRHRWPLLVGVLFGIVLGLFLGWVVWPVEWSNAWPNDLAIEAKADYVAAVADAYAGDPTGGGAALASERLAAFGTEIDTALAEARAHFEANPSGQSTAQIANIDALAAAVGQLDETTPPEAAEALPADTESTGVESGADPADAAVEDIEPADVEPVDSSPDQILPAEQESRSWLPLAIWLVVAFVLIAGGLFLLRLVLGMPSEDAVDEGEFEQPADEEGADGEPIPAAVGFSTLDAADEVDGHISASISDDGDPQNVAVMAVGAGALLIDEDAPDPDGYGFAPEPEAEQSSGVSTTIIAEIVAEEVGEPSASSAVDTEQEALPSVDDAAESDDEENAPVATSVGGAVVGAFTAHFQRSLDDYEQAFTIEDESGYIGDCGMGVNMKVGLVDNNPEHVAVLDVWLVDPSGQAEISYHALSLVSQYGVSAKLPERLADSTNAAEMRLAPTRGERFQLASANLVVDCEVINAKYDAFGQVDGVFTECQVEMTVRERLH